MPVIEASLSILSDLVTKVVEDTGQAASSFEAVHKGVNIVADRQNEIRSAMDEQNEGSKIVLSILERLRQITWEIRPGSTEMNVGSQSILKEMYRLVSLTQEILQSMDEMKQGTDEITKAVSSVLEQSQRNAQDIGVVETQTARFVIE